jgi:hypothetical protein
VAAIAGDNGGYWLGKHGAARLGGRRVMNRPGAG